MTTAGDVEPLDPEQLRRLAAAIDHISEAVYLKDRQHRWIAFNSGFCAVLGRSREQLLGRTDHDVFSREQADRNWAVDDEIFATGRPIRSENTIPLPDGGKRFVWTRKYLHRTTDGDQIFAISTDITELSDKLRAAERLAAETARQAAMIEAQRELIDELLVPVLDVGDGVLLVPLVGELTRIRAERTLDRVLERIAASRAKCVIFDVTGTNDLVGEVVFVLLRAFAAVRLLGCRSIVAGIRPEPAMQLIDTGMSLDALTTVATVGQALRLGRER